MGTSKLIFLCKCILFRKKNTKIKIAISIGKKTNKIKPPR